MNRAPALIPWWATTVIERLGQPPDTALTLGRFVAGSGARANARRVGIMDNALDTVERRTWVAVSEP